MTLPFFPDSIDHEFFRLLEEARHGDQAALGRLLDQYRPYLMKIAHDEGDSELQAKRGESDMVQDTCVRAIGIFHRFRGSTSQEMRGWLRQILLNQINDTRDRFRAPKRDVRAEIPLHEMAAAGQGRGNHPLVLISTPSEQAVSKEEREMLEIAIRTLPDLERMIIEMRQKEGRPFVEIARHLSMSEDTVQKRWARALQTLQEKMQLLYGQSSG